MGGVSGEYRSGAAIVLRSCVRGGDRRRRESRGSLPVGVAAVVLNVCHSGWWFPVELS